MSKEQVIQNIRGMISHGLYMCDLMEGGHKGSSKKSEDSVDQAISFKADIFRDILIPIKADFERLVKELEK